MVNRAVVMALYILAYLNFCAHEAMQRCPQIERCDSLKHRTLLNMVLCNLLLQSETMMDIPLSQCIVIARE